MSVYILYMSICVCAATSRLLLAQNKCYTKIAHGNHKGSLIAAPRHGFETLFKFERYVLKSNDKGPLGPCTCAPMLQPGPGASWGFWRQ